VAVPLPLELGLRLRLAHLVILSTIEEEVRGSLRLPSFSSDQLSPLQVVDLLQITALTKGLAVVVVEGVTDFAHRARRLGLISPYLTSFSLVILTLHSVQIMALFLCAVIRI
jgi:hypothetical protein